MNVKEWAEQLLYGENIEDKLFCPDSFEFSSLKCTAKVPSRPARAAAIKFSNQQIKFPKTKSLHQQDKRLLALHTFANHELMAIEIFAAFFLLFPIEQEEFSPYRHLLVQTLKEEQHHFKLYYDYVVEHGVSFGHYPLNDFFWKLTKFINTPEEFFAIVSLTLEAANLDFAKYYGELFRDIGDQRAAAILDIIYNDEIKHVALGRKFLSCKIKDRRELWDYYCSLMPEKFGPARSKGIIFDRTGRERAGLDSNFISAAENYRSKFPIVNRRSWK